MKLTDFTTLTFDCYGTLIDWETGIVAELRAWAGRHGVAASDEALLEAYGQYEHARETENPEMVYPEILAQVHRDLASRFGVTPDEGEAAAFGQSIHRWPAFPDTPDALRYLKGHFKLVILSNVDRASFAKSNEKLGVAFDAIITTQDVGSYKPDLRNFHYMLEVLEGVGVAKSDILHTAQSLYHDHVPAAEIGLARAWIDRRRGKLGGGATVVPEGDIETNFYATNMADFVDQHKAALAG